MGKREKKSKVTKKGIFEVCKTCLTGSCCKDGVDVDLEEAKKISKLKRCSKSNCGAPA